MISFGEEYFHSKRRRKQIVHTSIEFLGLEAVLRRGGAHGRRNPFVESGYRATILVFIGYAKLRLYCIF